MFNGRSLVLQDEKGSGDGRGSRLHSSVSALTAAELRI